MQNLGAYAGIGITGAAVVILLIMIAVVKRYQKAGPNEVLIVYGTGQKVRDATTGHVRRRGFKIVKGGGRFVLPVLESSARLSLEVMTIDIKTPVVYSNEGVPVIVDGVAQIKVKGDDVSIETAAEQFLGKSQGQIAEIATQTLEGHLRALIGTLTVIDMVTNRDAFAQKVQEVSAGDMANMGLTVISFVLRDIRDTQGFLDAWGVPRIVAQKRDAQIAEANAQRDATKASALAKQEGETAKFQAETRIAEADRDYKMSLADYTANVKTQQAQADLAYDLQKFKTEQAVRVEQVQVEVIEREKQIEVQEKEILRRTRELDATIEKPAEAERQRIRTLAEAEQYRLQTTATGQAEAIRATGIAEADATKAKGLAGADVIQAQGAAEATAMAKKADAWRAYNEAAIAQMVIEKLPEIARAISEPLAKTEKIVVVSMGDGPGAGTSKITHDVTQMIAQIPPVLEALTGMKLEDMIARVPQIGQTKKTGSTPPAQPGA
jgi:flotillin